MLRGMVKSRRESVELYRQGNRPELAAKEEAEIAVIEGFLPQQMDEAALAAAVRRGDRRDRGGKREGHGQGDGGAEGRARRGARHGPGRAAGAGEAGAASRMALPPAFLDELRARTPMPALVGAPGQAERRRAATGRAAAPSTTRRRRASTSTTTISTASAAARMATRSASSCRRSGAGVPRGGGEPGCRGRAGGAQAVAAGRAGRAASGSTCTACWRPPQASFVRRLHAPEGAAGLAYLRGRGLSDATIAALRPRLERRGARRADGRAAAGPASSPARAARGRAAARDRGRARCASCIFNRVTFPIRDRRGRLISFGGRALGDAKPKYINGPDTPVFPSGARSTRSTWRARASAAGQPLVVAEGYMDVIALHQAGFAGAVAPLGTALTEEQLAEMWRLSPEPVLCFDGDAAGRARGGAGARCWRCRCWRRAAACGSRRCRRARIRTAWCARGGAARLRAGAGPRRRPLVEALFAALTQGVGDGPEQRAALRARLEAAAATIGDRMLAAEYRNGAARPLLRRPGSAAPRRKPADAAPQPRRRGRQPRRSRRSARGC